MNRALPWINLGGVMLLAVLCAFQWTANRELQLGAKDLEREKMELKGKIEEQMAQMKAQAADLDQFRTQLEHSGKAGKEQESVRRELEKKVAQLESDREQLKSSVETWSGAVKVRDERIRTDQEQLKKLAEELNASIRKFNELAVTHSDLVKKWNDQQAKLAAMQTNGGEKIGAGTGTK